jgi:hypothetical protein
LIVGGMVVVALILIAILWSSLSTDNTSTPSTPTVPIAGNTPTAQTTQTTQTRSGPLQLVTDKAAAFDPGGNAQEHNAMLPNLFDDSSATSWSTECYQNQYLGAKQGVGIAIPLQGSGAATLTVRFLEQTWIASIYLSNQADAPTTLSGWGQPIIAKATNQSDPQGTFLIPDSAATYVLVWIQQLPFDPKCSGTNPYRATITDISLAAT